MSSSQSKILTIQQGTTFSASFAAMDENGVPVDLTGGTLDMQIRDSPLGAVWASSTTSPAAITIAINVVPTTGFFTVTIADSITKNLYFPEAYYDVRLTKGGVVTRLFAGTVRMDPQITR